MDSLNGRYIAERTVSGFPLSIGTGLAFESLFDTVQDVYDRDRQIPERVKIDGYKNFYINLFTIYRNLVGAIDRKVVERIQPAEYAETIFSEMEFIRQLVYSTLGDKLFTQFYWCEYEDIYIHHHKNVFIRQDHSEKQKLFTRNFIKSMDILLKEDKTILHSKKSLHIGNTHTTLLMSHLPCDLLTYRQVSRLDLIESHTGVLKPRSMWYSKYHKIPDADMNVFPFIKKLWLILGDNVMVRPMDLKFSRMIYDIAKRSRWTSLTTPDKVTYDLDRLLQERFLFELYKEL